MHGIILSQFEILSKLSSNPFRKACNRTHGLARFGLVVVKEGSSSEMTGYVET